MSPHAAARPDPVAGDGIRPVVGADLATILALNQQAVPAVSPLDGDALAALVDLAAATLVAVDGGVVAGFVVVFGPGAPYTSPNYRWFVDRYPAFRYVDRIVVAPTARGRGLGGALYDEVERRGGAPWLTCEVNLRPRNEASLRFHARRGFVEVGRQDTDGGAKRVALLAKALGPRADGG